MRDAEERWARAATLLVEQFKAMVKRFTTERLRVRRLRATLVITCDGCRIEED